MTLYDIDFSNLDEFGAVARSIESMLNCKSCLISVVDEESLAALGRSTVEPFAANQASSARDSICAHTVRHGAPVRVPDISKDPSLRNLPTVKALEVEAYIGVPLRLSGGEVIGAICGLSSEPRIWTESEVLYMLAMADLIESKIERHILRFEQSQLSKALAETDAILSALAEFPDRALTVQSASGELLFVSIALQTVIGLDSLDMLRLPRQVKTILDSGQNDADLRVETFGRSGPEVRVQILPIKSGLILADWTLLKT